MSAGSTKPRSASETETTLSVSESECQEGRLTERHLKKNEFRQGLEYEVYSMGGLNKEVYQIGAIINKNEPRHTGNIHFIDKTFTSEQEAEAYLKEHNK